MILYIKFIFLYIIQSFPVKGKMYNAAIEGVHCEIFQEMLSKKTFLITNYFSKNIHGPRFRVFYLNFPRSLTVVLTFGVSPSST